MDLKSLIEELYRVEAEITAGGCETCPLRIQCEKTEAETWFYSCDWITGAASELKALQEALDNPEKLREFDEENERIRKIAEEKEKQSDVGESPTPAKFDKLFGDCKHLDDIERLVTTLNKNNEIIIFKNNEDEVDN